MVEANPLTQKFLPEPLVLRPSWENRQNQNIPQVLIIGINYLNHFVNYNRAGSQILNFFKSQSKWNALCDILLPWFALLKVRSITSPKIWVQLRVLIQKYFISFFKKATGLGHLWINWGPSKHARIDPNNLQKTEALHELWELCLHPMCVHVLPFYLKSKGILMGCRIPLKENHSPQINQGNFCAPAHTDPQLGCMSDLSCRS